MKQFLTLEEAAGRLSISSGEVLRLVDQKKLYPVRDGGGMIFKVEDLDLYLMKDGGDSDPEDNLDTLDVEAMIELETESLIVSDSAPSSAIELELDSLIDPASVVVLEASLVSSIKLDSAIELGQASVVGLGSGVELGEERGSDSFIVLNETPSLVSGHSFECDDLELDSIIAASVLKVAAEEPSEEGTISVDLGEPILSIGSAIGSAIGSPNILDSGILIDEKVVELEGIQTWDEVDLGIEDEESEEKEEVVEFDDSEFDEETFVLGGSDEIPSSDASDIFPSSIDSSGLSDQYFGESESLEARYDSAVEARFSLPQVCGLVCCSIIILVGGVMVFDLVRTIGSSKDTMIANPISNAMAETFGWR